MKTESEVRVMFDRTSSLIARMEETGRQIADLEPLVAVLFVRKATERMDRLQHALPVLAWLLELEKKEPHKSDFAKWYPEGYMLFDEWFNKCEAWVAEAAQAVNSR